MSLHPLPLGGPGLAAYLASIQSSDYAVLTPDAEAQLGTRAGHGDCAAQWALVAHNLRWAASFALRQYPSRMESSRFEPVWTLSDTIQEANLGLLSAAARFQPEVGRFTTYAVWWMRQRIARSLQEYGYAVRLPVHIHEALKTYRRIVERLGPSTELAKAARALGWTPEKTAFVRDVAQYLTPLSLDAPVLGDDGDELAVADIVPDPASGAELWDRVAQEAVADHIHRWLGMLKPREADVLRLRFGLDGTAPHTLEEIGRMMGLTRERIRQIESKALARLRVLADREPGSHDLLAS